MSEALDVSTMNLHQKLAKIRDIADVVAKNKSGYGYRYVSEDEVLAKVKAGMSKYHVSIYPMLDQEHFSVERRDFIKKKYDKASQNWIDDPQSEYCVRGWLNFKIVNDDNPDDYQIIPWVLVGSQTDDAQAFGSALTYANRYFFLKFFNIATPDADPDEWKRKKSEAANAEEAAAVAAMIKQIEALLNSGVTEQNKTEISAVIKKHLKVDGKPSANYLKIQKLEDAQAVYAAVKAYLTNGQDKQ